MEILLSNKLDDAIVAYIVKRWNEVSNIPLGRIILQKLCYFVKSKGVPLSYDFDIYHYGPYSQELYYRMDDMVADNVVADLKSIDIPYFGIMKSNTSQYKPGDNIEILLAQYSQDLEKHRHAIDQVVEVFSELDPKTLELLSTIHYFQTAHDNYYNRTAKKDEVISKVKQAKGDKFSVSLISEAYDALLKAGIFKWDKNH